MIGLKRLTKLKKSTMSMNNKQRGSAIRNNYAASFCKEKKMNKEKNTISDEKIIADLLVDAKEMKLLKELDSEAYSSQIEFTRHEIRRLFSKGERR